MKDSTRATRSATANEAISTLTAWYAEIGTDEQTSSLFWNAMADPEARTPEEWFQFTMVFHGIMLTFQNSFYLANEGTLDEEIHQSMTEVLVGVKDQPGLRRYWGQRKSIFYRDFKTMSIQFLLWSVGFLTVSTRIWIRSETFYRTK